MNIKELILLSLTEADSVINPKWSVSIRVHTSSNDIHQSIYLISKYSYGHGFNSKEVEFKLKYLLMRDGDIVFNKAIISNSSLRNYDKRLRLIKEIKKFLGIKINRPFRLANNS